MVRRVELRNVIVNIGKTDAILPKKGQIPGEYYRVNDRIRVYVLDVRETSRLPQVVLSHIHPRIVQELFELEVPEIEDGIIEIKSIAREAGYRTKIAVQSYDENIDPQGACIGPRGSRIQTIVNELKNEKIDIIEYVDDPVEYIKNALKPARVASVNILEDSDERRDAMAIVPDDQLSLAIGKEGQNVRLAHRLTGWKIDIKSISQYEQYVEKYEEEEYSDETVEEIHTEEEGTVEEAVEETHAEEEGTVEETHAEEEIEEVVVEKE